MSRILLLTGDLIDERIAGPAVRTLEIARALSIFHKVTLACPKCLKKPTGISFDIEEYGNEPTAEYLDAFDAVFTPGSLLLTNLLTKPLIVDLYDPFILSNLARFQDLSRESLQKQQDESDVLFQKLTRGDFFLCASEKQRDFWLGMLAASRRINPEQFIANADMYRLIDLLPFGIPSKPPEKPLQCAFPGQSPEQKWLIWAGGIWNWFDPITLLEAILILRDTIPEIRLYFMGTKHPNPAMPMMEMAKKAIEFAEKHQLKDCIVFFGDWIPYAKRGDYLASSDLGVSTHLPHIETRFSFRTRILDYIWARTPIICTQGDSMAELVMRENLGFTVPPEDPIALAESIRKLLTDKQLHQSCKVNLERISEKMTWSAIIAPLAKFCDNPYRATDSERMRILTSSEDEKFLCGCESKLDPVGEIFGTHRIEFSFLCFENHLNRIDLKLATYSRDNDGMTTFKLLDAKKRCLWKEIFEMRLVRDNAWRTFRFQPVRKSKNQMLTLVLESMDSGPGNAITAWSDSRIAGKLSYGGKPHNGSLTFRAFYKRMQEREEPLKLMDKLKKKFKDLI